MTANLDQSLEPGETIVYRTRGRSFGRMIIFVVSALVGFGLYQLGRLSVTPIGEASISDLLPALSFTLGGIGAFGALILLIAAHRQRSAPDDVVITNRRLLFSKGGWTRKVESTALRTIERIAWSRSFGAPQLEIVADGRILDLPSQRNEYALAKALADSTGSAAPPDIGPMAFFDLSVFGVLLVAALAYPLVWLGLGIFWASRTGRTSEPVHLVGSIGDLRGSLFSRFFARLPGRQYPDGDHHAAVRETRADAGRTRRWPTREMAPSDRPQMGQPALRPAAVLHGQLNGVRPDP